MLNKLKKIIVPAILAVAMTGCSLSFYRHSSNSNYQAVDGSDVNISMSLNGKVRLNTEETDIEYLPAGSEIRVSSRGSHDRRKLTLHGLKDGEVESDYEVNGQHAEFDDEAKSWFATVVPIMASQGGIDIPDRVQQLYNKGGEELVLDRIASIKHDPYQGRHLIYLLEQKSLSDKGIERSIGLLSDIEVDHELSKVMIALAKNQSLTHKHWLQLLKQGQSFNSDHEVHELFDAFGRIWTHSGRMIAALQAAQNEGGDSRGKQSDAILVVESDKGTSLWKGRVVDLRVDDRQEPIKELIRLVHVSRAYARMTDGDNLMTEGKVDEALAAYTEAETMMPQNHEAIFWHAATLAAVDRVDESLPLFKRAFTMYPLWREVIPRLPASGLLPDDQAIIDKILAVKISGG